MSEQGHGRIVTAIGSEADQASCQPSRLPKRSDHRPGRPRLLRVPADWWNTPPAVACPLSRDPQSATAARRLARETLCDWGLASLAADAEIIVGELAANAVTHGVRSESGRQPGQENLSLRLRRRSSELICAVLDPSDTAPVLRTPGSAADSGRGLQIVNELSDVWGWSPVAGQGKAVWAILFVPHGRTDEWWGEPP
jgi:anti-sigma regulatory factor (Ser/Thr protein kinase)